jgi:hypothetical protein
VDLLEHIRHGDVQTRLDPVGGLLATTALAPVIIARRMTVWTGSTGSTGTIDIQSVWTAYFMPFNDKRSKSLHAWLQCPIGRDCTGKTLD